MPIENYNEYRERSSESMQSEIDAAIDHAKSDLNDLKSEILWWKKVDFKTPDSINKFYRLENWKVVFQLDQVKNYLSDVHKRLSWMKNQKFWEISKENNFTWTTLAVQIALKALGEDPINPKKYNIWRIDWEYNETTKEAIKQFQSDQSLNWIDGKPGKNTIWAIIKSLEGLMENRKEYVRIKNIVKSSININATWAIRAGIWNDEETINSITNYIVEWKIWTNSNPDLEEKINNLARHPLNKELQDIVKIKKEWGKLNILNQDERFNNTKYDNYIVQFSKEYSKNYKVDPALIKIMMYKESKFDPKARSGAWAKWLMQLMPIAVKEVNKEKTIVRNVYDPKQNIEWWIKLFSNHLKTFKWNVSLALAAYNAGAGSVKKAWNRIPNKRETKNYVKFITNEYNKLKA